MKSCTIKTKSSLLIASLAVLACCSLSTVTSTYAAPNYNCITSPPTYQWYTSIKIDNERSTKLNIQVVGNYDGSVFQNCNYQDIMQATLPTNQTGGTNFVDEWHPNGSVGLVHLRISDDSKSYAVKCLLEIKDSYMHEDHYLRMISSNPSRNSCKGVSYHFENFGYHQGYHIYIQNPA